MAYARATRRRYPFRHFDDENAHGTANPPPAERLGLSEAELAEILQRYRQSLNLGVEDLARLIGAAEMQAAGHRAGPSTAADTMSRDLVTVGPATPIEEVAELFRRHGFTSLPVVGRDDEFLGVIFQIHLIGAAGATAPRRGHGSRRGRLRRSAGLRSAPARAAEIMATAPAKVTPATPVGALLPLLAQEGHDAIPMLAQNRIVGLVTQTDLITALSRQSLRAATAGLAAG